MPKRALVYLACGAIAVGPALGAFAAAGPSTPAGAAGAGKATDSSATPATSTTTAAPPAHAEAAALLIDGVIGVGHTTADAGPDSSSASANAVELGGKPLIDGTTGGTQKGSGSSNGALLDTGSTPLGQLQLTPWQASAAGSNGSSSSDADAALARVILVDPSVLKASVLQSSSHARYDSSGSSGSATSDGAVVDAGNGALTVDLLHAESSSSGSGGSSYLASINGNEIGTSDQANGSCTLTIPQLIALSCLTASGGPGSSTASSAVGTATIADGQLPGGQLVASKSSGAKVATGQSPDGTRVKGEKFPSPARASSGSSLPLTGSNVAALGAIAALAVAAGAWIQQVAGRRRHGFGG